MSVTAVITSALDTHVAFTEATQTFALTAFSDSLALLDNGTTEKDYPVTMTIVTGSKYDTPAERETESETFDWTIKNPCIDQSFVTISKPILDKLSYKIYEPNAVTYTAHGDFAIVYAKTPTNASLCGTLKLEPFFDTTDVIPTSGGDPLSYNPSTKQFTCDTDDISLLNDKDSEVYPYSIVASLNSWPTGTYATAATTTAVRIIEFNDPCLDPFTFETRSQPSASDNFSGTSVDVTLNPFEIFPALCEIAYTCVDITRADGVAESLTCADLTALDNLSDNDSFNGSGELSLTIPSAGYLDGSVPPGVYTITIKGSPTEATSGVEKTTTITLTLTDPCDPPVSISAPSSPAFED